jgi:hypothetical protein
VVGLCSIIGVGDFRGGHDHGTKGVIYAAGASDLAHEVRPAGYPATEGAPALWRKNSFRLESQQSLLPLIQV